MKYKELLEVKAWKPHPETTDRYIDDDGTVETFVPEMTAKSMRADGWVLVGGGAHKDVWRKPRMRTVRLLMPVGDGEFKSGAVFQTWHQFCRANSNNPYVPKYSDIQQIQLEGVPFLQCDMESLKPIKNANQYESCATIVSNPFDKSSSQLLRKVMQEPDGAERFLHGEIPELTQQATRVALLFWDVEDWKHFYETLLLIESTGRAHGFRDDFHSDNFMGRSNGQVVFIDPWTA